MRPPHCTLSDDFYNSDCGSAAWARFLFSREDIRRFKQAWPSFLGCSVSSLEFEMRIYDGEFTVGSILEQCRLRPRDSSLPHNNHNKGSDEVDLKKLASIMLVSADPDRGIAFSGCLIILAHYNVINDSQSLRFVAIPSIPFYQVLSPLTYIAIPEKFVDAQYDDEVTSADHTMTSSTPSSPQRPSLVGEDIRARALVAVMSTGANTEYHGATGLTTPVERLSGHSRESSSVSVQDVMESLDNSAWGQSIRRSFTRCRSRD
ncbi:hypothetical protein V8E54_005256 [Elaphomyces granulatus]